MQSWHRRAYIRCLSRLLIDLNWDLCKAVFEGCNSIYNSVFQRELTFKHVQCFLRGSILFLSHLILLHFLEILRLKVLIAPRNRLIILFIAISW